MKHTKKYRYCFRLVLLLMFLLPLLVVHAQENTAVTGFWNDTLSRIAMSTSTEKWIDFKPDANINPLTFFKDYKVALRISKDYEMRLLKVSKSKDGYSHYRFEEYYKNYKIPGAQYLIHIDAAGKASAANGTYIRNMNKVIDARISKQEALQKAMNNIGASQYKWQDKNWEKEIKERTKKQDTSYFPKGSLVWTKKIADNDWSNNSMKLAYQFDIYSAIPRAGYRVEVDAVTGEIINKIPFEQDCTPAFIQTIWNGGRTMYVDSFASSQYRLFDNCQNPSTHVYTVTYVNGQGFASDVTSADNNWTSQNQLFGGSVLWTLETITKTYSNWFGFNGYNNAAGSLTAYINALFYGCDQFNNCGYTSDNAAMDAPSGSMYIGLGSSGTLANSFSTFDILAHEYGHSVTYYNVGLNYSNESGAINESYSDMLGNFIQSKGLGLALDYLVGENRTSGPFRSMSNPNLYAQPDTYLGTYWYNGTADFGGVHTNSGVMNYWFYLITAGGSGTNDNGDAFSVSKLVDPFGGDAVSAAANVIYGAYDYMTPTTNYADVRRATIASANSYYGSCSGVSQTVTNAWYAVGVGSPGSPAGDGGVCGNWPTATKFNYSVLGQVISPPASCAGAATTITSASRATSFSGTSLTFKPGFLAASGCNFLAFVSAQACSAPSFQGPQAYYAANTVVQQQSTIPPIEQKNGTFKASVFPNPATTSATVQISGAIRSLVVTLTNMQGKVLWQSGKTNSNIIKVPINTLAAGLYFINVSDDKYKKVLKLVKE